jgi:ketosteroid isomerase-like protein
VGCNKHSKRSILNAEGRVSGLWWRTATAVIARCNSARQGHPNARLLEVFYQAQAAFYGGGDDPTSLLGLLSDDVAWHVPGRSAIAGDYHGHDQVLGYFATRRARANTSLRVHPRAILADDRWAVQLADGHLERNGQRLGWQTAGVFRIAGGKIAECWLLPFDQYRFDEIWGTVASGDHRRGRPPPEPRNAAFGIRD